jgi:hypothetical protein
MPLTDPPEIPLITEPSTFSQRAQDWVVWQADELYPFLTDSAAVLGLSLSATSTTSNTVGTGSKSFTVETGKGFVAGNSLSIARTAAPTNRMFVVVDSYNTLTGALVVTSQAFEGSGTFTDWSIAPAYNGVVSNAQLSESYISDLTLATLALDDLLAGSDTSSSGNKKKFLASTIRDLFYPRNYISGLTMSTAGSSATMSIAAGEAKDSTNAAVIQLAASISKTTSAWALGTAAGGLDTGVIANSTWYHFYLIRRPDTGVVDVTFSTNAATPTLPANYTQFRRIGAGYTNGSAQWTKFIQLGDMFTWSTPDISANNATVTNAQASVTTLTPLGVKTVGIYGVVVDNANSRTLRLYGLDDDDLVVTRTNCTVETAAAATKSQTVKNVVTNTSSQVAWKADASTTGCYLQTLGYIDTRGA